MPYSVLLLEVLTDRVRAELYLPLTELKPALNGGSLPAYLREHVRVSSADGVAWRVSVGDIRLEEQRQPGTGPYREYVVHLTLYPPAGVGSEVFTLHYDAVVHRVATHKTLVRIRRAGEETEVGAIGLDAVSNVVPPLRIDLRQGGAGWRQFRELFSLGVSHILEGTDHLLFLFLLLLPAPLLVRSGRWAGPLLPARVLRKVVGIVTGFTLGHSLTLLLASLGWLRLPVTPVEIGIGLTIAVTAVHAVRPLFARREVVVAAFFGLVHGLGFAGALAELALGSGSLLLGILGFNLGIELVQLALIVLVLPWLLLLAPDPRYRYVRWAAAGIALLAAAGWVVERLTGVGNWATAGVGTVASWGAWLLLGLALVTVASLLSRQQQEALS